MQTKEIKPMHLLCFQTQTSLSGLSSFVGTVLQELYREAYRLDLFVTGPNYWIYHGMDGNPDTLFTLEIALPVAEAKGQPTGYYFKQTTPFRCVSTLHTDAWEKMPGTYQKLMTYINANNLIMNGECREMYINIDFTTPENNITEVQVGLQ